METKVFGPDLRPLTGESFNPDDPDDCVHITCPYHNDTDKSLAIYAQHAYCYGACRQWFGYRKTLDILGGDPDFDGPVWTPKPQAPPVALEDLKEMAKAYQERMFLLDRSAHYLTAERRLSLETVRQAGLGFRDEWWGFSIPIYSFGKFETIRYRRLTGEPKYIGTKGRNRPLLYTPVKLRKRILWVEGEFDCLIGCQLGHSTVTMTNGVGAYPTPEILERLTEAGVEEADVCVDNDRASFGKSFKYADVLERGGITPRIIRLPQGKDLSEAYKSMGDRVVYEFAGHGRSPVEWWRD